MTRTVAILRTFSIFVPLFSVSFLGALIYGSGFREEIEVVNQTSTTIFVTPIGKWHGSGRRSALPVTASRIIHWPALKNGDFAVAPGKSIVIDYDGDDIDPTEIYINAGPTKTFEKSVKSRWSPGFDPAKDEKIVIADLSVLPAASAPVTAAAVGANKNEWKVIWVCVLLFGPLVVSSFLRALATVLKEERKDVAGAAILFTLIVSSSVTLGQEPRQAKSPDRFWASRMNREDAFPGFATSGSIAKKLAIEFSRFSFFAKSDSHPHFPRAKTDEYGVDYEVHGLQTIRLLDGYYKQEAYPGASYVRDEELSKNVSKNVYVLPIGKEDYAWLHGARIMTLPASDGKKVRATISWREVRKMALSGIEEEKEVSQDLLEGGTIEIRERIHRVRKIEVPNASSDIRPFVEIDQELLSKEEVEQEKAKAAGSRKRTSTSK